MPSFKFINPDLLSILAAIIAIGISQIRDPDQMNIIGEFLTSVGDLVSLEATEIESRKAKVSNEKSMIEIHRKIEQLQKQFDRIQKTMN